MKRLSLTFLWLLCFLIPTGSVVAQTQDQNIQRILFLTNQARSANNLPPLKLQSQLTQAAQGWAAWLAEGIPFSHTDPSGGTPFTRMQAAGFTGPIMGENIARGFPTTDAVFAAWKASPGHWANILYPSYTQIGIGIAGSGGSMSWVQDFGAGGRDTGTTPPVTTPPVTTPPVTTPPVTTPPVTTPPTTPQPVPVPVPPAPKPVPVPSPVAPPTRYVPPPLPGYWNGLFYRYYGRF